MNTKFAALVGKTIKIKRSGSKDVFVTGIISPFITYDDGSHSYAFSGSDGKDLVHFNVDRIGDRGVTFFSYINGFRKSTHFIKEFVPFSVIEIVNPEPLP